MFPATIMLHADAGKMWKDQKMLPQLEQLIDSIDIMSLQITELDDIECLYYIALIRAH
jgi:hypothetical protein